MLAGSGRRAVLVLVLRDDHAVVEPVVGTVNGIFELRDRCFFADDLISWAGEGGQLFASGRRRL